MLLNLFNTAIQKVFKKNREKRNYEYINKHILKIYYCKTDRNVYLNQIPIVFL